MTPEPKPSATNNPLPFDEWKTLLRKDCERQDHLRAFDALGDSVLHLLWESGIDPSCQAIIESASKEKSRGI